MKDRVDFAAAIVKELTSIIEDRVNKAIDKKFTDVNGNKLDVYELVRNFAMETIGITEKGKLNPEFIKIIREEVARILAEEGLEEIDEDDEELTYNSCNKHSCNKYDCDGEFGVNGEDDDNDEDINENDCNECDAYEEGYNDGYQTGYDVGYKKGYDNAYHDGIREGVYRVVTSLNDFFKRNNLNHRITITSDNTAINIIYDNHITEFRIPIRDNSNNPRCKEKYDNTDNAAEFLSDFHDILRKILHE